MDGVRDGTGASGVGVATVSGRTGEVLDAWFPVLGLSKDPVDNLEHGLGEEATGYRRIVEVEMPTGPTRLEERRDDVRGVD